MNTYLIIYDVDYSHGIIFGVDQNGQEIEASWSGIVEFNVGDIILINENNRYIRHFNLGDKQ